PDGIYWKVQDWLAGRRAATVPAQPRAEATAREPVSIVPDAPLPERKLSGKPILELQGVSRSFGGLKAVNDVSLVIPEGEIYGVIGPNGAGKTTLFNVVNGFIAANSGSIRFAGQELVGLKPYEVCARGLGRTFQVVRSFPRMTVLENVAIGAFVGAKTD